MLQDTELTYLLELVSPTDYYCKETSLQQNGLLFHAWTTIAKKPQYNKTELKKAIYINRRRGVNTTVLSVTDFTSYQNQF